MNTEGNSEGELSLEEIKGKKKVVRALGRKTNNKPKPRKSKNNNKNQKEYNYDRSMNYSKFVKERFLYMPFYPLPDLTDYQGDIIEVRIASEYLCQTNKAFIEKRVWGSDIYTSDSDIVCILQHSGYFKIKDLSPTNIAGVSVFLRVTKGRSTYNSSNRNGLKSKKLSNFLGHSIKPENYSLLKHLGSKNELLAMASRMPVNSEYEKSKPTPKKIKEDFYNLKKDYIMVFNLSYELWLSYSIPAIADEGQDFKDFTSWKLKDKVLYIETTRARYEIARNSSDHKNDDFLFEEYESFRLSKVHSPFEKDNAFISKHVIPLSESSVDVIFSRLDWHELEWGEEVLKVRNVDIGPLKCFNYYKIK